MGRAEVRTQRLRSFVVGLLSLTAACKDARVDSIVIPFTARIGDEAFSCRSPSRDGFVANDLRMFVHSIRLKSADGKWLPVKLAENSASQQEDVALLDFESGSDNCRSGSALLADSVTGTVASGAYRGLRFQIGVPFEKNHANPAIAQPPLNVGSMHWGWQAGYKFMRFEGVGRNERALRFHLGSTGCDGTIGNITGCSRPNRATIDLPTFVPGRNRVVIQMRSLIDALEQSGSGTDSGSCMGDFDDPNCKDAFAVLDLGSPQQAGQHQRLFAIETKAN